MSFYPQVYRFDGLSDGMSVNFKATTTSLFKAYKCTDTEYAARISQKHKKSKKKIKLPSLRYLSAHHPPIQLEKSHCLVLNWIVINQNRINRLRQWRARTASTRWQICVSGMHTLKLSQKTNEGIYAWKRSLLLNVLWVATAYLTILLHLTGMERKDGNWSPKKTYNSHPFMDGKYNKY